MDVVSLVRAGQFILTDSAVETRVAHEFGLKVDPQIGAARLVQDPAEEAVLRRIYGGCLEVARTAGLPAIIGTPTFRAGPDRLENETAMRWLNGAAVALHQDIRRRSHAFIAGVIGPRHDAYQPERAPNSAEARRYHAAQCEALARAGADLLFAATFPAFQEARGAAWAMAGTTLPYVVSFVLRGDGRLLDGTALYDAVARIDEEVSPRPAWFSASCVHPAIIAEALASSNASGVAGQRLLEARVNASRLAPEALAKLDHLDSEDPETLADATFSLYTRFGLRVLGGCCGTDDRHLRALARRMAATVPK